MMLRPVQTRGAFALACTWCMVCAACADGREFSGALPVPDGQRFVSEVYPLLLRDCAFVACHGAPSRFLQIYGPGRARLDPDTTMSDDPATLTEVLRSYDRARSMLTSSDTLSQALLLTKPLEPEAGGQGHQGVDDFGRNLFSSTKDPGYALLLAWAGSKGSPPTEAQVSAANEAATSMATVVAP